jgi:hypothetical protein
MAYSYVNKKGQTYWLHVREGKGGARLYCFSKNPEGSVDLPDGLEVIENERTGLPMVKRKS